MSASWMDFPKSAVDGKYYVMSLESTPGHPDFVHVDLGSRHPFHGAMTISQVSVALEHLPEYVRQRIALLRMLEPAGEEVAIIGVGARNRPSYVTEVWENVPGCPDINMYIALSPQEFVDMFLCVCTHGVCLVPFVNPTS